MLKAFTLIDFSANAIVFSEPFPLPEKHRGLLTFVNRKINFSRTKVNERIEQDFEGTPFFGVKMSEKHLVGCMVVDANPKRRLIFKLLETCFDLIAAQPGFDKSKADLNGVVELRQSIQKELADFERGKGDATRKISNLQDKIREKTRSQIDKEMKKMDDLMEVKTEVEETEKVAQDNEDQAKIVKREAFLLNAKMWLLVYGSTILIVAGGFLIFFKHFF